MQLRVGQLFVRELTRPDGTEAKNTYMVCGIIKTDQPIETEATHILSADLVSLYETHNVEDITEGKGFSDIMQEPIWRVKI